MDSLINISIRGRMAYGICLFERLLLHYKCEKQDWTGLLEKLWMYTSMQYLDDWMYEFSEWLPDSILEDSFDDFEFITKEEYEYLYKLYNKSCLEIRVFIKIIFELGSVDLYSKITDNSPNTLNKLEEAINIFKMNSINIIPIEPFKKYSFWERNGWGERFDGRSLSIIL